MPLPTVLSVIGTRPDAIKMAPVIRLLEREKGRVRSVVVSTTQHREMVDQVLATFRLTVHHHLGIMREDQTLASVTENCVRRLGGLVRRVRPDWVVVQGDTTSSFIGALVAYYERIPVAHVEAGLRTDDKYRPFPEEINRRLIDQIADLLLAPTPLAREKLLREGHPAESIVVTGNTAVDALLETLARLPAPENAELGRLPLDGKRVLVVTAHRRESFGEPLEEFLGALRDLVSLYPDVAVVYPVHPNPHVRGPVKRLLAGTERVHLLPPLSYTDLLHLLRGCYMVLTDSGGLQEEVPSLGKPILVLREVTERTEGIAAGTARLVGMRRERVLAEARRLLDDGAAYAAMARAGNPYGDGRASRRIVDLLLSRLTGEERPVEEFRPPAGAGTE